MKLTINPYFDKRSATQVSVLLMLCAIVTVIQSYYVGDLTLYGSELAEPRKALHEAILNNRPLKGAWGLSGDNGINVRVLTVYAAEAVNSLTGLSYGKTYKLFDMASLFLTLALLYSFLRHWHPREYCLIAVLFIGAVLPMTYALHLFHPWDRPGLLLWLLFAWAVR